MGSFFKRASRPRPVLHPIITLIDELNDLDPKKRDGAARQLTILWSAFQEDLGITRFLQASQSEQDAYLNRLDRIVERGRELKHSNAAAYYYSTSILSALPKRS